VACAPPRFCRMRGSVGMVMGWSALGLTKARSSTISLTGLPADMPFWRKMVQLHMRQSHLARMSDFDEEVS